VQWDQRLEARLAAAILSVQAFKGIEIGDAFENTCLPGTQAQDAILLEGVNLHRRSNRAGGIEGGMSKTDRHHAHPSGICRFGCRNAAGDHL